MTTAIARRSASSTFVLQALGLSIVIALSGRMSVPFWPVPMTLQTLAVMAIAGTCGARLGVAAMLAVLAEGALGLPVFANGGGMATLMGPTAGYLAGMVGAAALVGAARGLPQRAGGVLLGTALIYVAGAAWLSMFVGVSRAIDLGVLPFLAGDAVKGALVLAICAILPRRKA